LWLGPFSLALVLLVAGAVPHMTHLGWWVGILALAALAAWLLTLLGQRAGLSRDPKSGLNPP
jgi:Ca2+/Na+ antiporter